MGFQKMKIFGILAFALGVSAQYDYDDMGNKKNKGTQVDKGPRECGGVKANDMGNLTWSCRSRNKKNGKTKGNTKHCKAQCPDGWKVQTGGQGTRKLRCSTTANGGLKWVNKKDMDATGPSVNPSKFSCKKISYSINNILFARSVIK